jgi:hypothetical protein
MKKALIFFLSSLVLFTSCQEDEAPQSFLSGTYELAWKNPDSGIWNKVHYIFETDGSYSQVAFASASDGSGLIGYTYYSEGTYTLQGEDFSTRVTKMAGVNHATDTDGYADSIQALDNWEITGGAAEYKGKLRLVNGGKKIGILMDCNDILMAMCAGEQIYERVDLMESRRIPVEIASL